jgi:hypothetical protein
MCGGGDHVDTLDTLPGRGIVAIVKDFVESEFTWNHASQRARRTEA